MIDFRKMQKEVFYNKKTKGFLNSPPKCNFVIF